MTRDPSLPALPVTLHVRWLGRQRGEATLSVETEVQWDLVVRACGLTMRHWQRRPLQEDELRLTLMRKPPELTVERVCEAALALTAGEAAQTTPCPAPRVRDDGTNRNAPGGAWDKSER